MTAECFCCGDATESFGNGYLCNECILTGEGTTEDKSDAGSGEIEPRWRDWNDADFVNPNWDTYSPDRLSTERWMGRAGESGKQPFSPWADRDHPDADEDARWKWGIKDNYVDGETVSMAEDDPRLDGRVFIQLVDDNWGFIDGDDVRRPETGAVYPAFIALLGYFLRSYHAFSTIQYRVFSDYHLNTGQSAVVPASPLPFLRHFQGSTPQGTDLGADGFATFGLTTTPSQNRLHQKTVRGPTPVGGFLRESGWLA